MRKNNPQAKNGEIRIIAGQWRSRKLKVADGEGLRPTTDRVRETLFNWLQFDIASSICLDACAGSGALGFEALSRGAAAVHFVEKNDKALTVLRENSRQLVLEKQQNIHIHHDSIEQFLSRPSQVKHTFDIVFVDPPYKAKLHNAIFIALLENHWLSEKALIYCETPVNEKLELPNSWQFTRKKNFKNFSFGLIEVG